MPLRHCAIAALSLLVMASLAAAQTTVQGYATGVVSSTLGSGHQNTDPNNALGNTPSTFHSLGNGGVLVVDFNDAFTTSGNSNSDLFIDENGASDCYWICLTSANAAAQAALAASGWNNSNGYYQIPLLFCGDVNIDIDYYLTGHAAGALKFNYVMVEDDTNGGDGCEINLIRANYVCEQAPPPPGCVPAYASTVTNFYNGANQMATDPNNALGNTPNTYFSLGDNGTITVGFGSSFSNSGNNAIDIFVDEWGDADCYWVCVRPANAATAAALQAAGLTQFGNLYQIPQLYCGDASIDLDNYVSGSAGGALLFDRVMIEDDGNGGNGAEIILIRVDFTCPNVTPPPPPGCFPGYASCVVDFHLGSNNQGTDPNNALGNTPTTYHSLGSRGNLRLCFAGVLVNDGGPGVDIFVDEFGAADCYSVGLKPANSATMTVLNNAGFSTNGSAYMLPATYCGDGSINIDAILSGYAPGTLQFSEIFILDDGDGGNGAEVALVSGAYICPLPCAPEYASTVVSSNGGLGGSNNLPTNALGNTPATFHRLGNGGQLCLAFPSLFTTDGGTNSDIFIDEYATVECYFVSLDPADSVTEAALAAAGFMKQGTSYAIPQLFCGDQNINLDALIPGFAGQTLYFESVCVTDDQNGSSGAEINLIRAEYGCPSTAKIGNFIWTDVNCDGDQDGNEAGFAGIEVRLYNAAGSTLIKTATTADDGSYCFVVAPGEYTVRVMSSPQNFTITALGAGGDETKDSNLLANGFTAPIMAGPGTNRLDIDGGLCVVCSGVTSSVNTNLPACGLPQDPVITAPAPHLGSIWAMNVNSVFPGASVVVLASVGPPSPWNVPGTSCTTYVDLGNFFNIYQTVADANGDAVVPFVWPNHPAFLNVQFTIQVRVCEPSIPGPIAGFPDWLSNGMHLILGCP